MRNAGSRTEKNAQSGADAKNDVRNSRKTSLPRGELQNFSIKAVLTRWSATSRLKKIEITCGFLKQEYPFLLPSFLPIFLSFLSNVQRRKPCIYCFAAHSALLHQTRIDLQHGAGRRLLCYSRVQSVLLWQQTHNPTNRRVEASAIQSNHKTIGTTANDQTSCQGMSEAQF